MAISREDRERLAEAIRASEATTSGEIVCVVARASSSYAYVPIVWASLIALVVPWPLIWLTMLSVERIYLAQIAVFALAALLLSVPRLRMLCVPRPIQRARAHHAAVEQFMARGLTRTKERRGVLVFVSLAERYARIIADDGIAAQVPNAVWQETLRGLVAELRQGRTAEGLSAAIAACGRVLAEHFPASAGDTNELPDRVYVI